MLLSGANPNTRTDFLSCAPVLAVEAKEGFADMVSLLLEFNATVDAPGDDGMSALCYAATNGHTEILRLLCSKGAKVGLSFYSKET